MAEAAVLPWTDARPLVSIVVPAYNVAPYLEQALDSLVRQTHANLEILLVDDGSTDGSAEIGRRFAAADRRVRLTAFERNRGLPAARNAGMELARGKYLAFLDGDDWAYPDMIEALVARAERTGAEVVLAEFRAFDDGTGRFGPLPQLPSDHGLSEVFDPNREPHRLDLQCHVHKKLYLRSFIERHGVRFREGLPYYEDIPFDFEVMLAAGRVTHLRRAVLYYRQNRPGQVTRIKDERIFSLFDTFDATEALLTRHAAGPGMWRRLLELEASVFTGVMSGAPPRTRHALKAIAAPRFACLPEARTRALIRGTDWKSLAQYAGLCAGEPEELGDRPVRDRNLARAAVAKYRLGPFSLPLARIIHTGQRHVRKVRRWLAARGTRKAAAPAGYRAEVHEIYGREIVLFEPSGRTGLRRAVERMKHDDHLLQFMPLSPGDTVVDVGAHGGAFAISVALAHPQVRVFAVEPDPANFETLLYNIRANNAANVTAVYGALGAPGLGTLFVHSTDGLCGTLDPATAARQGAATRIEIEVISPGEFFRNHGIDRCRILKISAPGAVREILERLPAGRIDFLTGMSDVAECPPDELAPLFPRAAGGWCWRSFGGPEPSRTIRGGYGTPRPAQAAAGASRAA